jgi:hypothetical protein
MQNLNNENFNFMKTHIFPMKNLFLTLTCFLFLAACTQEQQNKIGREIQNWTGTDGVLEIYAGDKLVRRFLKIDKLSTALGTDDGKPRDYRYGYGYLDSNLNMQVDPGEKRVYFEISNYTNALFFENPN